MIEFSCHCGYCLKATNDLAGSVIQCPQCKRLNDIPLLSDLQNLDDEGFYRLDEAPKVQNSPERVAELTHVFTREHFDSNGVPIDLRGTLSGPGGSDLVPVEALGPLDKAAPKYDPLTGELVEAIDLKPEKKRDPNTVPVARLANLLPKTVVDGMDVPKPFEAFLIPVRLLRLPNLLVMAFVLLTHVVGQVLVCAVGNGLFFIGPVWLIWHGLIVSHFGNVIDESGPGSNSELPTPLRHLGWHEDLWGPFKQVAFALIVCYFPGLAVLLNPDRIPREVLISLSGCLLLAGTFFFPAVLMTMTTSGSVYNLRPDRVCGVVFRCGVEYLVAVVAWIIGGGLWLAGLGYVSQIGIAAARSASARPDIPSWPVAYGILLAGIVLLHFFCCHLGILYRKHYAVFPWILQRHDKMAKLRALGFPVAKPAQNPRTPQVRVQTITEHPAKPG